MRIYVAHSTAYDYNQELYQPLRSSAIWHSHTFILPHKLQNEAVHSKKIIAGCDIVLAEVTYPSIGVGIELGWAEHSNRSILCLYKKGVRISSALHAICNNFIAYSDHNDMIDMLSEGLT